MISGVAFLYRKSIIDLGILFLLRTVNIQCQETHKQRQQGRMDAGARKSIRSSS